MEIQEEAMMGSNDLSYIAKGKRTKRQRPQSPIVLAMATTTSSSSSGGGDSGGGGGGENNEHHQQQVSFSPTSSTGFTDSTEEEEDMANCLILLAKGHGEKSRRIEEMGNVVNVERFTSRRFTEADTSNGKGGFYVYECKTCNRCFPSFQALGGHRASHKKPKNMVGSDQDHQKMKSLPLVLSSSSPEQHDHHHQTQTQTQTQTQILPIQISRTSIGISINNNKSKVHECSICGSEFSSGQALGGHMRRHRTTTTATSTTIPTTTITNNQVQVTSTDESDNHQTEASKKTRNLLSLDLNLPAPSEDDHRGGAEGKFSFGSSKQSHLVFSASALVDCHY